MAAATVASHVSLLLSGWVSDVVTRIPAKDCVRTVCAGSLKRFARRRNKAIVRKPTNKTMKISSGLSSGRARNNKYDSWDTSPVLERSFGKILDLLNDSSNILVFGFSGVLRKV